MDVPDKKISSFPKSVDRRMQTCGASACTSELVHVQMIWEDHVCRKRAPQQVPIKM